MSLSLNGSQIVVSFGETSSSASYSDGRDPPVTRDRSLWTCRPSASVSGLVQLTQYCTAPLLLLREPDNDDDWAFRMRSLDFRIRAGA